MRATAACRWLVAALALATTAASPAEPAMVADALFRAGVQADLAGQPGRAYVFYRLAAEAGRADAEFNVAVMNDSGIGTARDRVQAALWYARAASHGFARASYDLGELALSGDGIPRNTELARSWFASAGAAARAGALPATTLDAAPPTPVLDAVQADPPMPDRSVPVELVWHIDAMPGDTQFSVQVVRLDPDGRHDVAWTTTRQSALLLAVPQSAGLYAWRVLASSVASGHYTPSSWASFRLR